MKIDFNKFNLIDVLEGLKQIDSESVDIIISDPPYNIGKDFGNDSDKQELDHYLNWCDQWINECIRVLKPSGSFFIYGFSEILAHISVRIDLPKRWLIWHYTNKTIPSYHGWQRSHESIIYIWKEKPVFNRDEVRVPYSDAFLKSSAGKKRPKSKTSRFGDKETTYEAHEGGALPKDVFTDISTLAGGAGRERYFLYNNEVYPGKNIKKFPLNECIKHPTQKPSKLTEKLIKSCRPKGDCLVVIPFGGSGSEGVVCKRMEVDFVGFDINPDYIKLSNLALEKYKDIF